MDGDDSDDLPPMLRNMRKKIIDENSAKDNQIIKNIKKDKQAAL